MSESGSSCPLEVSADNEGENVEANEGSGEVNGFISDEFIFSEEFAVDEVEDLSHIDFEKKTLEELKRYHFPNTEMGFLFYNWYASLKGFAARKSHFVRNNKGDIIQQTFVCHREGLKDEKYRKMGPKKRESKPVVRCNCMAKLQVHLEADVGRWYIKHINDVHNHSLVNNIFKGLIPGHRKMSEYDKYQMATMNEVGIKTTNIFRYAASQAGGFDKVGYSKQDMYNERRNRRKINFSDAKVALDFLQGLTLSDNNMFWKHTVGEDGQLENLFWCDGVSRLDYSVFGDVIAFHATYKKVKYLCSLVVFSGVNHHNQSVIFAAAIVTNESEPTYVWLLEQFLIAMNGKMPVSVITDGDPSMKKAIGIVFPNAHHRLCAWHLIRNVTTNIKNPKFLSKFKHCMFGEFDIHEFEARWGKMVEKFGLDENLWVLELYEKRRMWSSSYIRGSFFAGFRTTSRCEGLNSEFARYVNVRNSLLDFLKHFFSWLDYMRYREFEADFGSSYGEPVLQTKYPKLEMAAARVYTKEVMTLFRPFLEKACNCVVVGSKQIGRKFIYSVSRYDKEGCERCVTFCESSLEFKCSCLGFESWGIPCEHIVAVFILLGIKQLPESLVLKRWTKEAKDTIVLPCSKDRISRDSEFISKYVGIVERCKKMATLAVL